MTSHLWGIVLAGGGDRHRPLARRAGAGPGRQALLRRTLDRVNRLIPAERLVAVLVREHSAYYDTVLPDRGPVQRIVQPVYRGTAPELFLPVLRIARQDPHAVIVVMPSDHMVDGEARLMSHAAKAARAVSLRPDLPVVIGASPPGPDPTAAWIEPGDPVEGLEAFAVRSVRRFFPRPTPAEVSALYEGEGLLNTQVIIATARALIEIGRRYLPDVLESLEPLEGAFGTPEEGLMCEAVYEQMPYANIAHALFVRPHQVAVLPVAEVRMWRDAAPQAQALAS